VLELPAIIEAWKAETGYSWAYIARLLGVGSDTLDNWRKGRATPWASKAEHLASLIGKPELVHVVERDRVARLRAKRAELGAVYAATPTPRTLVIPRAGTPDGAA